MSIGIITAVFGDYDDIPVLPDGFDEAILVSDVPIKSKWKNVVHRLPIPPRLNAKIPKCRPDFFLSTNKTVWVDASMKVDSKWLLRQTKNHISDNSIVLFRHPERSSILQESSYCANFEKYRNWPIQQQVNFYKSLGFKDDFGLWAGGLLIRNSSEEMIDFGNSWLIENFIWSIQDQISLPYLAWKQDLNLIPLTENLYNAPITFFGHKEINIGGGFRQDMDYASLKSAYAELLTRISVPEKEIAGKFLKKLFKRSKSV